MTPERFRRIGQLFQEALERAEDERAGFLEQQCAGDAELRREVESLLSSHHAEGFIPMSVTGVADGESRAGQTLGHYQLLDLLGSGGMGEVYRARDLRLDREVAIKLLPILMAQSPEAVGRFEREAKAVAALAHPNIRAIYDFGGDDGVSYAVMELLEGETLRARLKRVPLPQSDCVQIGTRIADGLAAAHDKGIIHRDLKPENVFLTVDGQTKILDFGLARLGPAVAEETLTQGKPSHTAPGIMLGTRGYMSPEQIRGQVAGPQSDIFSLGCILYEMLSGRAPFARPTLPETIAATLNEEPPALARPVPGELKSIVRQCLRKDPGERFPSARELLPRLKAIAGNERSRSPRNTVRLAASAVAFLLLAAAAATWLYFRPADPARGALDSLAVLPLSNLSSDREQEYFADGMTEELIAQLAKIRSLRVISRTSIMKYKGARKSLPEIARELDVLAVVEGSVRREGNRVRITAQLIHAPTDRHLWAESYERDVRDALVLQTDVAKAIASEIKIRLTTEEKAQLTPARQVKPDAYDAYLQGIYANNKGTNEGLQKSVEYFSQSIERDPEYAAPHARLATAFYALGGTKAMPAEEALSRAAREAQRALDLDPGLAEAHVALGQVRLIHWDWPRAEAEIRRALELDPNSVAAHNALSIYLAAMGRAKEAVDESRRARDLDPLLPLRIHSLATMYSLAGEYDRALAEERKALQMSPDMPSALVAVGVIHLLQNRSEEALPSLEKARDLTGRPEPLIALAYARSGRRAEALKLISEIADETKDAKNVQPTKIALVYAELGLKDQAFDWLQRAYEEHDAWLVNVKLGKFVDPLRSDPRYLNLLKQMGLPP